MSTERKKSGYHFELVNPRRTKKKYRFYFFDYLYYMGEVYHENRWGEKSWRMSGFGVLMWYWGLILYPFLSALSGRMDGGVERAVLYGWGLFPAVFCLLRYRKARRAALMNHYDGKKRIGMAKLLFLPLALFVLELWLFGRSG